MPEIKAVFVYQEDWEAERFTKSLPEGVQGVPVRRGTSPEELDRELRDAHVVIGLNRFPKPEAVQSYKNLKLVQTLSAGTDTLPIAQLAEQGVRVANNHGGNAVAVAEVTVAMMVAAYRRLMVQWDQTNNKGTYAQGFDNDWGRFHELTGKRVGIVGLGQIGSRVAKRLQGWECEVVYTDIRKLDPEYEAEAHATRVTFDELIETSDVITLHVPLDRTTNKMISDPEFDRMKPGAVLVNACRGPVVDQAALVRALDSGKIAGAALDVTEIEPIEPGNPLVGRDNVVILPHRAGLSIEAREKSIDNALRNTGLIAQDRDPQGIVLPT